MASLQEDAANIAAARAKRRLLTDNLASASELADAAGLSTAGIYEALAEGRKEDKTDPDYWTFKIMQYLYEYVPFGKAGKYFVPVILGLGLYKAFEMLFDVISSAWTSLKASPFYQSVKEFVPFLPDRVVRDGADGVGSSAQVQMMQAGLVAILPPYAALAVTTLAPKIGSSGPSDAKLVAENAQLKKRLAECEQRLASASTWQTAAPLPISSNLDRPAPAPQRPDIEDVIASKGIDWALNKIDEWLASDRVVRDMNSSASLGLANRSRNNF